MTTQTRTKEIIEKITELASYIYDTIKEGGNPVIRFSSRGISNIIYNDARDIIELADRLSEREFFNAAHVRRFVQMVLVAARVKTLLEHGGHASQRELYYQLKHSLPFSKENTFEAEEETIKAIEDLERYFRGKVTREEFHITADRRGALYGDLILIDRSIPGKEFEFRPCELGRGGWAVSSTVEEIEIKEVNADYVLVIESAAMFERLIEEGYAEKEKAILIAVQGQASRGVRRLIHRLRYEHDLPVIVFTDGDPWGYYIYSVIKRGSINLAYLSEKLATPDCKFVGMTMDDIEEYNLYRVTEKLKDADKKRLDELMRYPWFKHKEWQRQLAKMKLLGVRLEQQALASKGLDFVANKYLPEKIKNGKLLP